MGGGQEKRVEKSPHGLRRACGSGRPGSQRWLGLRVPLRPATWPLRVGTAAPSARRRGRQRRAKGGSRAAGRATETQVVPGCGLTWLSRRRWGPRPWSPRP